MAAFLLLLILKRKNISTYLSSIPQANKAFLLYIVLVAFSKLLNSGLESAGKTIVSGVETYFVFMWAFVYASTSLQQNIKLRRAFLVASLISVVYGVMQILGLDVFHRQHNLNRISGFHSNPYTYGGQLIVLLFFLLETYLGKLVIPRKWIYFLLMACVLCILNTSERAVIIAVAVSTFLFLYIRNIKKGETDEFVPLMILFFIPLFITRFINSKVLRRVKSVVGSGKRRKNPRFKLWNIGVMAWKKNLFFGVGKYPKVMLKTLASGKVQYLSHAHSVYLQFLVTSGIVGLFAYLNLMVSLVIESFKRIKISPYALSLIAVIVAFSIEGIFEYNWGDSEVKNLLLFYSGFALSSEELT